MLQKKKAAYERLSPAYEESMQNPCRAEKVYPGLGSWYAAFLAELSGSFEDGRLHKEELLAEKEILAREVEKLFDRAGGGSKDFFIENAKKLWRDYLLRTAEARAIDFVKGLTAVGADNPYEAVLQNANPEKDDWMEEYGLPVVPLEREMMKFWFSLPKEKLESMGNIIVDAFLHGFISQSRERRGRKRVRFFYQLGQEALAKEVIRAMRERDLIPIICAPQTLYKLNQWQADHRFDRYYGMDRTLFEAEWAAYEKAMLRYEKALKDTCGMAGIGQFGTPPCVFTPCRDAFVPDETSKRLYADLRSRKENMESEWIRPSEISFCWVTFPNMLTGERFKEIFNDYFEMNSVESEPYERIQQKLIDGLDTCEYVEVKGYNGNETNIRVSLWPLADSDTQTGFLNCGGDLNIPYGEVFTTPRLKGTSGLLHIEEICLQGVFYHGLRIIFKDGWIINADCAEGKEYVMKNLLYPFEKLTMGEFAIGTNTRAYAIARKYQINSRLPILIYEKMGPHIAIGDPCFARSEDPPVYNMYDHKDMVCRENELTQERKQKNVYFGKHIDITLPYDRVEYIRGIRPDKSTVDFIRHGRFVLEGTEPLNEGLE